MSIKDASISTRYCACHSYHRASSQPQIMLRNSITNHKCVSKKKRLTSLTNNSSLMRPKSEELSPSPNATSRNTTALPLSTAAMTAGSGPPPPACIVHSTVNQLIMDSLKMLLRCLFCCCWLLSLFISNG